MVNLLKQGSDWLGGVLAEHASGQVTYRRGLTDTAVNAVHGKTDVEIADESGLTIQGAAKDFLILASQLPYEPEPGDVIVADGRQYEVMPLAGDSCWRWSDPYRKTYRIHTKDIGDE